MVLEPLSATKMSRKPSPFTSARNAYCSLTFMEPNAVAAWKVPSPFPSSSSMPEPALDTMMSSFPSPFTSPTATPNGSEIGIGYETPAWNVPSPLPRNTQISGSASSNATKSILPSPLKSPCAWLLKNELPVGSTEIMVGL